MELGGGGESPGLGGAASLMAGLSGFAGAVTVEDATTGEAYCSRHFEILNFERGAIDLSTCCEMANDSIHCWRWPWATDA